MDGYSPDDLIGRTFLLHPIKRVKDTKHPVFEYEPKIAPLALMRGADS